MTLPLEVDRMLVEEAVYLEVRRREAAGDLAAARRYHRLREAAYSEPDASRRERRFEQAHAALFEDLGLVEPLREAVAAFPVLEAASGCVVFRHVSTPPEEGADWLVPAAGRGRVMVRLRAARLADPAAPGAPLDAWLRHELAHAADLADPAFLFDQGLLGAGGGTPATERVRERLRLVWGVSVDARARSAGWESLRPEAAWRAEFDRGYAALEPPLREAAFRSLWAAKRPTYPELVALARRPELGAAAVGGAPGTRCPLCGFVTWDWASVGHALSANLVRRYPGWRPEDGACGRCAEVMTTVASA